MTKQEKQNGESVMAEKARIHLNACLMQVNQHSIATHLQHKKAKSNEHQIKATLQYSKAKRERVISYILGWHSIEFLIKLQKQLLKLGDFYELFTFGKWKLPHGFRG